MSQEQIYRIIFENDDVGWKNILYDLVKNEGMNPWDIDISLLTQKYINAIKKMKDMDFNISGKVVLSAAILLKMKSAHLLEYDINALDQLIAKTEEQGYAEDDDFFSEFDPQLFSSETSPEEGSAAAEEMRLIPRTPRPRKRKVSIFDLADALQKAMEVRLKRIKRKKRDIELEVKLPIKDIDVTELISEIYNKVVHYYDKNDDKMTFSQLIPSDTREGKIFTFVPLLHLEVDRKIDLNQKKEFGEIYINLIKKTAVR